MAQYVQQMIKQDDITARILRELARDGRISNLELADRVGLSPSACLRRVQELERSGVIKGYRAVLDPGRMGVGFVAYVSVGLGQHTKAVQEAFEPRRGEPAGRGGVGWVTCCKQRPCRTGWRGSDRVRVIPFPSG
jgi:DNA-binding Lrp family transcriptional regulator